MSTLPTLFAKSTAPTTANGAVLDRSLTLILVLVSGHPVLMQFAPEAMLVSFLAVLLGLGAFRRVKPDFADLLFIMSFFAISVFHIFQFQFVILSAVGGFLVKLLIAFLCTRIIKDFERNYVEVMYVLAIISVLTFGLYQSLYIYGIDPHAAFAPYSLLDDDRVHIGLHNFNILEETHRNSGLFWEPGAFAGYLLLGIVFLAAKKNTYTPYRYRIRLVLFTITLLSTQSTIGYLLAPIALAIHAPSMLRWFPNLLRIPAIMSVVAIILIFLVLIASQLSFLWPKYEEQLDAVSLQESGWETTRIGSALYDAEFIVERPLGGWSAHPMPRESIDPRISDILRSHGNGLTTFVVRFGLFGLIVFVIATLRSVLILFRGRRIHAAAAVLLIIILMNGEQYLDVPLFLSVMFVGRSPMRISMQIFPNARRR